MLGRSLGSAVFFMLPVTARAAPLNFLRALASALRRLFILVALGVPALAAFAALGIALSAPVWAGTITIGGPIVASPTNTENFDSGANTNSIGSQYAASGITVVDILGNGIARVSNATCNNSSSGVSGGYLYMSVINSGGGCFQSSAIDVASIQFAQDVSELSWFGFNAALSPGFLVEALHDDLVVSSTIFDGTNRGFNQSVRFAGSVFDEIRFTELGSGSQSLFFALDDFRWITAAANQVPLPGTLSLIGIALGAFGLSRRRKARTSA